MEVSLQLVTVASVPANVTTELPGRRRIRTRPAAARGGGIPRPGCATSS